jgi:formylglycine-generating enzyme required for sulfatase activity
MRNRELGLCIFFMLFISFVQVNCKKNEPVSSGIPPSAPELLSVQNGAANQSNQVTLEWQFTADADSYSLQISTDTDFVNIFFNQQGITASEYTVTGLSYLTTYYWRVKAVSRGGTSAYSKVWHFTTTFIEMVPIIGGTYSMGVPKHDVTVSNFSMSKTEVTQKQWLTVMASNPSGNVGDNLPVEEVNWYAAVSFCNKLSIKEGKTPCYSIAGNTTPSDWTSGTIVMHRTGGYRLPTEGEWEYAAEGGKGQTYSGTNTTADLTKYAWYGSGTNKTMPVAIKLPNAYGLYDMTGNAWEWCWDWYAVFTAAIQVNPEGPATGAYKVLRGACWYTELNYCVNSYRLERAPSFGYDCFGLRVAQD